MRSTLKRGLAAGAALGWRAARGATLLTYHRVGGGTSDELDLPVHQLEAQLDVLLSGAHAVVSLDAALDRLDAGDDGRTVVLTFDDGFVDVFTTAWPLLRERKMPFTVYLTAGLVGAQMRWERSAAASQGASAMDWDQLGEMAQTGLCTVGNHTWDHPGPGAVDVGQLDRCSDVIETRLGRRPSHFAWTWGVPVADLLPAVRGRFRSGATGVVGRNLPGGDRHALARVPVRASDPLPFFHAKLTGNLGPERAYAGIVQTAKVMRRVLPRE